MRRLVKSYGKTLYPHTGCFKKCLWIVCSCSCVFVGEKRGLGGNHLVFFGRLMSVRTFLSQPQNDLLSCFALFFSTRCLCGSCFPRDSDPPRMAKAGHGRSYVRMSQHLCGSVCLSYINIRLELGLSLGALYPSSSSLRGVLHQTLPPCSAMPVRPIVNSHNSEFGWPGPFFSSRFAIEVQTTPGMWHCVIVYGCFKWQFEALVAL